MNCSISLFMPNIRFAAKLAALTLVTVSHWASGAANDTHGTLPRPLAIEHVTVLSMAATPAPPLRDATVVVRNRRIESIAPSATTKIPSDAERVDGRGKYLMPSLTDCHVHIENDRLLRLLLQAPDLPAGTVNDADAMAPYVAHGVLQVINMSAMSESVGQRDAVESYRLLGPHIALAAMVDGSPPIWPPGMTRIAESPEAGRQVVRDIKAEGYDLVKVYSQLTAETYAAILDEAGKQQIKVLGHIPERGAGRTAQFFRPGYAMVAHAEEFAYQSKSMSDEEIAGFVAMARASGTWLTASLTLNERILEQVRDPQSLHGRTEFRYISRPVLEFWLNRNPYIGRREQLLPIMERVVDFNRRLVKAFAQAGIPVVAGTDSLVPGVVGGLALHDELAALARAGLSNDKVLAAATRLPAEWLGVIADRGTVEAGKRADLLLLDGDPLTDIGNTRRIAAVIAGGRYLPRRELDGMLSDSAKRNQAAQMSTLGN